MESIDVAAAPRPQSASGGTAAAVPRANSVALDQWRGLALLLVLISHGLYFTGRVHGIGRVGVNLFFFISGVLVFRSLSKGTAAGFNALAKDFWWRRLKRLYPALAAYLLAMIPITVLLQGYSAQPYSDLGSFLRTMPFGLVYIVNYLPFQGPMSIGHLWSVSCEMQFYLLAPCVVALGGQNTVRRLLVWGALLAVLMGIGFIGPFFDPAGKYKYHFEQAVWPMMLGFCCEYRKTWFQRFPAGWPTAIVSLTLALFGASLVLMIFGAELKKLVIITGAFVCVPCFVAYANGRDIPGFVGRGLAWIGERTYSIYLWQQPFTICGFLAPAWHPLGAFVSIFVGGLWFKWFERPFLSVARKHYVQ